MSTQRDDLPAFPCDTSVSMAFAVFENAHKPLIEEDYTALRDRLDSGMTLRQYAAIKLKVPDSGTDWLDEMIRQSLWNDFASKALIPSLEAYVRKAEEEGYDYDWQTGVAKDACFVADAMLTASEGGAA